MNESIRHTVEKDKEKIQELLLCGCTFREIQKHLYPEWREKRSDGKNVRLRTYLKSRKIKLVRPNHYTFAPVKSVLLFWELVKKFKKGKITINGLSERTGIKKHNIRHILRSHNIKIPKTVYGKHAKQIIPIRKFKRHLRESEQKLVDSIKEGELFKLLNCGCDFLYKNNGSNILIEVKDTLSTYNLTRGIIQLLFAKDIINMKIGGMWFAYKRLGRFNRREEMRYFKHFEIKLKKL